MSVDLGAAVDNYMTAIRETSKGLAELKEQAEKKEVSPTDRIQRTDALKQKLRLEKGTFKSSVAMVYTEYQADRMKVLAYAEGIQKAQKVMLEFLKLNASNATIQKEFTQANTFGISVMQKLDEMNLELAHQVSVSRDHVRDLTEIALKSSFENLFIKIPDGVELEDGADLTPYSVEPDYTEAKECLALFNKASSIVSGSEYNKMKETLERFTTHFESIQDLEAKIEKLSDLKFDHSEIDRSIKKLEEQLAAFKTALSTNPSRPGLLKALITKATAVKEKYETLKERAEALDRPSSKVRYTKLPNGGAFLVETLVDPSKFVTEGSMMIYWAEAIKKESLGFEEGSIGKKATLDYITRYLNEELAQRKSDLDSGLPLAQERFTYIGRVKYAIETLVPEIRPRIVEKDSAIDLEESRDPVLPSDDEDDELFETPVAVGTNEGTTTLLGSLVQGAKDRLSALLS